MLCPAELQMPGLTHRNGGNGQSSRKPAGTDWFRLRRARQGRGDGASRDCLAGWFAASVIASSAGCALAGTTFCARNWGVGQCQSTLHKAISNHIARFDPPAQAVRSLCWLGDSIVGVSIRRSAACCAGHRRRLACNVRTTPAGIDLPARAGLTGSAKLDPNQPLTRTGETNYRGQSEFAGAGGANGRSVPGGARARAARSARSAHAAGR